MDKIIIEAGKEDKSYWKDLRTFKGLFYFLAWRDILVRYKQTSVGIAWAVLRPLLTIFVLSFIRFILDKDKVTPVIPYPLLIAAGTLPWQFFSSAFSDISNSLVSNSNLISKVYFPRIIVPVSAIVVCVIDFLISFLITIPMLIYYHYTPGIQILLLPLFLLLALIAALGVGLYIASLNVKYRDFKFIIPFIVQFGMFASPVMISSEEFYKMGFHPVVNFIYSLNPMVSVIDGFRWCVFGENVSINWLSFSISSGICLLFLIIGIKTFRKMEKSFADVI